MPPSQRETVSCSSFSCNPLSLYWSPIGMMVKCGGERHSIIIQLSFGVLMDLCLRFMTFTRISLVV